MEVSEGGMQMNQKKNEGQYNRPNEHVNKTAWQCITGVFTCCFHRQLNDCHFCQIRFLNSGCR